MDASKRIPLALSLLVAERTTEQQRQGLAQLDRILSVSTGSQSVQLADYALTEPLKKLLIHGGSELRTEVLQVLAKLAREHEWCRLPMVDASFLAVLSDLVANGTEWQSQLAMSICRDLMCVKPDAQDVIANAGLISQLVKVLDVGTPEQKYVSASVLARLASPDVGSDEQPSHGNTHALSIAKAGAIPHVIYMIAKGAEKEQMNGVALLERLCLEPENAKSAVDAGCIRPVFALLKSGGARPSARAAALLSLLARCDENKSAILKSGSAKTLVKLMTSGSDMQKANCTALLSTLLSDLKDVLDADHEDFVFCSDAHEKFFQAGVLKPLCKMVTDGTYEQKLNAAWAFQRLAILQQHAVAIVEKGASESLVRLLNDGDARQSEAAASAIETLAWHRQIHDVLFKAGALHALVGSLAAGSEQMQRHAVGLIAEFAVNDKFHDTLVRLQVLPVLLGLVSCDRGLLLACVLRALKNLAEIEECTRAMRQRDFASKVVAVLVSGTSEQKEFATRLLLELSVYEECAQTMLEEPALRELFALARHGSKWQATASSGLLCILCTHKNLRHVLHKSKAVDSFLDVLRGDAAQETKSNCAQALRYLADDDRRPEIEQVLAEEGFGHLSNSRRAAECLVCMEDMACFVHSACAHLTVCGSCRQRLVQGKLGRCADDVMGLQLKRTPVPCPVCRAESPLVYLPCFQGEVFVCQDSDDCQREILHICL